MEEKWRFLEMDVPSYVDMSVTLRPAIAKAKSEGKTANTVVICRMKEKSLGISYYSDSMKDVDIKTAEKMGIDVKRLGLSGGGSVFIDDSCPLCLVYVDRNDPNLIQPDELLMMKFLSGIADQMSKAFEVPIRFRPLNDGEIWDMELKKWKKIIPASISGIGSAIQIGAGVQIRSTDAKIAQKIITPPAEKFVDKQIKNIEERIGSLEGYMGEATPSVKEVSNVLKVTVEECFGIKLVPGELTNLEKEYIEESRKLYDNDNWLHNRSERKFGKIGPGASKGEAVAKVPGGPLLRVTLLRKGDHLQDILFTGSLHASPVDAFKKMEDFLKGIKLNPNEVKAKAKEFYKDSNIKTPMITYDFVANTIFNAAENSRQ
ncbi:MAG: hypothetical protein SWH54_04215 [Thermodesulfobacteriota bacterium]|nr:hypothetical protein [Thermodesulfobacteriota bacterium]